MSLNLWTNTYQSDEDASLKAQGSSLNFGLNSKVVLTKFAYAKDLGFNKNQEGIDIEYDVAGSPVKYTTIINPDFTEKVYHMGKEVLDKSSDAYKAGLDNIVKSTKAVMTHYLKATGKTDADLGGLFASSNSWSDFMQKAATFVEANLVTTKKPLDLFLQYQSNLGNKDKTFLEVPSNLLYGSFITAHMPPVGEWKEERAWTETAEGGETISKTGLRYVDDAGNVHRFHRDDNFMKGKNASQQVKAGTVAGNPMPTTPQTSNPQQTTWES